MTEWLGRAPQRPRTRETDVLTFGHPLDRANPSAPAGVDPGNIGPLLALESSRRGRNAAFASAPSFGARRWPRR